MKILTSSIRPLRTKRVVQITAATIAVVLSPAAHGQSATTNASPASLAEFDLEQLLHVKVTSVSKRPEELSAAPAAIYVISGEELQRSGVTTLADAMRGVPGMDVGRIDSHRWAVSSRGFNSELASKLLVVADGRSVYTPLFSGVYWDTFDTLLEDVERVEVIRGPGATLWGANAVNGVINLTTKSAKDTQGTLLSGGGGSEEQGFAGARHGGKLGENAYARVYGKYFNRDESALANGDGAGDDWWMARGGFRVDWDLNDTSLLTLQGDAYDGEEKITRTLASPTAPYTETSRVSDHVAGGNFLGRWTRTFSAESELRIQTYYDHTVRESALPEEVRDTFDLDLQHRFSPINRNVIVWGAGYQVTSDDLENGFAVSFDPDHRTTSVLSAFVQDEITLIEERLHLTLGTKLEHNDYTDYEFQPGGRLAWTPTDSQTVWAAISRAVRTPSRAEDDVRINLATPVPSPAVISILGDRQGKSEELVAYEIGYRAVLHPKVSLDVALFYNQYDELRSLEPTTPPAQPPFAVAALASSNGLEGDTYGAEVALRVNLCPWWLLIGSYTFLEQDLKDTTGMNQPLIDTLEGSAPEHQWALRSQMNLPGGWTFDAGLRYVGDLSSPEIPAYLALDARVAWQINEDLEISIVGQNLTDDQHPEFAPSIIATPSTEVERSVYAKLTWRF